MKITIIELFDFWNNYGIGEKLEKIILIDKEDLKKLGKYILKNCPEENKQIKKYAIEFIVKIWDICPNPLKIKLFSFLFMTKFINHNNFNFTMIAYLVSYQRIKDKEFDRKLKELLKRDDD